MVKIETGDHFTKRVPRTFVCGEEECNYLEVSLFYSKEHKGYAISLMPVKEDGYITTVYPSKSKNYMLTHNVMRKTKKNIKDAIEVYNSNIGLYQKIIKNAFNLEFKEKDLKIKVM